MIKKEFEKKLLEEWRLKEEVEAKKNGSWTRRVRNN